MFAKMNTKIALIFLFINASFALKCQVCENDGVCNDNNDNGVETECPEDQICGYFHEGKNYSLKMNETILN